MTDIAIETRSLTKAFSATVIAADNLSLSVPRGAVYGLIGRNGAGKTTALRMVMGLLRPDWGKARVLGASLWQAPASLRAKIAYVPQAQQLHGWMAAEDLCQYLSFFYPTWDPAYARQLARRWEVRWDQPVGSMSGGEQRKVSALLAFAARPEVMILDEPAANLDPIARRQFVDGIVEALSSSDNCTVLLSTHILSDLERVADHVGIMERGRLLTQRPLEEFQSTVKRVQVIFEGQTAPPGFAIPGAVRSETAGPVVTAVVNLADDRQLDEVRRIPGVRVNVFDMGLEQAFIDLLSPDTAQGPVEVSP